MTVQKVTQHGVRYISIHVPGITVVELGLSSPQMLTFLMLVRLSTLCPSAVLQRLDRLVEPLRATCTTKVFQLIEVHWFVFSYRNINELVFKEYLCTAAAFPELQLISCSRKDN